MSKGHDSSAHTGGKGNVLPAPAIPTTTTTTTTASSTTATTGKPAKPNKPYPEYPLTAHPSGSWCKKIRGKLHYFGPWSDPEGALASYLKQKDALHAGKKPRADADALTVKELANAFLNHKQKFVDSGELSPRTWQDYKLAADEVVDQFGKMRVVVDLDTDDFAALRSKLAKRFGPHRLGKTIQCVRCLFKYGAEAGLLDKAVRFGPGFARPSKKTMRLERARQGPKLFAAEECRKLIDAAGNPLKAMLLLAINGGYGNSDVGNLPLTALALDDGWIDFPRPKTGIPRRCPLWPETVQALQDALAKRKEPVKPEDAGVVVVTKYGERWAKDTADNPVTKETKKLLNALGITGRHRLGFYTLRHVFRTVAEETKDQPAVDHIMGHESAHMASVYRETISNERLKAVTDHVRTWLFGTAEAAKAKPAGKVKPLAEGDEEE